jgi:hypothetical protein
VAAATAYSTGARAFGCEDDPLSTCIDSNQRWPAPGETHFAFVPGALALAPGSFALSLVGGYQYKPLLLRASSPDPEGREIPLVEHVVDSDLTVEAGLGRGLDMAATLRFVPYQSGTGIEAARSRVDSGLAHNAVRDPLVGVGYEVLRSTDPIVAHALKLRGDLSLPWGDATSFAGERGPVFAPSLSFQLGYARLSLAAQLGARLRQAVTLADLHYTNQLVTALGFAVEALSDTLFVAAEATAAPGLGEQPDSTGGEPTHWIPAEWALTATARFTRYQLLLSGGSALPLSSKVIDFGNGNTRTEHFAGLGSPELRFLLGLRVSDAP